MIPPGRPPLSCKRPRGRPFFFPGARAARAPIIAAFAFALTCAFAADPAALRVDSNGRVLVDANDRPVFLLADTAWNLAVRLNRADAETYLQQRKAQGFNTVALVLFTAGRSSQPGAPVNIYGDEPFKLVDGRPDPMKPLTTPGADPADAAQYDYWDHVDYLVALTRRLGFYAILLPTWGSSVAGSYNGQDTSDILFNAGNARSYGAWLSRRYGRQPHVLWMLGGDRSAVYGQRDYRPVIRALAAGLKEAAPDQLITYHPRKGAPQSSAWFHDDAWLAFNSIQQGPEQQLRAVAQDWSRTPPKPTWLAEGRYEAAMPGTDQPTDWGEWQVRFQAYQTVFAGALGHMYGHAHVFGFGADANRGDWKEALDAPGARSVVHLAALMRRFTAAELRAREPDPQLIEGDAGKVVHNRSDCVVATFARETGKAMIFSANGRAVRVRMARLPAAVRHAFWFNPRRGTWHRDGVESAEPVAFARDVRGGEGAAVREFVPPTNGDGQDWVLVLAATEKF